MVKMLGKCSFQDCWLKDSAYQEWVPKDNLDKHYTRCVACEIQLIFCVPYRCNSPYKSVKGPYLALVQVSGDHAFYGMVRSVRVSDNGAC